MNKKEIEFIRREYSLAKLEEAEAEKSPFSQFAIWMQDAKRAEIDEPNAMFLATTGRDGIPSGRIVLLKGFDEEGFLFFTNYESRKGRDLTENPFAAIDFFWKEIERQVRIQGRVIKTTSSESDEYFMSRPPGSRLSAIISEQSRVVPDRAFLEKTRDEWILKGLNAEERPAHWGGYRIQPFLFEFWQGREHRLHDRVQYRFAEGKWIRERLAP